jgi:hypothetical protein
MNTPEFQGTHLWDRLCWAKENLEGYQSEYRVVYEDSVDDCAKILVPDPNWMAAAMQGGILPPVWVYWELAKDEAQPDFKKHTRGYLLHDTEPMPAMTEEEAIEYLIQKDIPQSVWQSWDEGNSPKMVICRKDQLPETRVWRNAWRISKSVKEKNMAVTTYIVDKDGNQIDKAEATSIPTNRDFRGAWSLSGKVISEDMTKAKELFKDKIREKRQPLLEAEDVVYMKALEAGDSSAQTASAEKKKSLRDAPAAQAITDADTIAKLKAAWDTSLLGDSPYS